LQSRSLPGHWLFVGSETTGQRAAIIYTMVECAKRHGHNPEAWLTDVLERLPAMTNQDDLSVLLPANWQPATAATALLRETCPPEAKNIVESIHTCVCYLCTARQHRPTPIR